MSLPADGVQGRVSVVVPDRITYKHCTVNTALQMGPPPTSTRSIIFPLPSTEQPLIVTFRAEVLLAKLKGAGKVVKMMGSKAPAAMILRDVAHSLSEVKDDWARTWSWLHDRTSLDAGRILKVVRSGVPCRIGLIIQRPHSRCSAAWHM